ncbi:hypothetical protein ACOME3_008638 [Neoechinorhynchus agilis]
MVTTTDRALIDKFHRQLCRICKCIKFRLPQQQQQQLDLIREGQSSCVLEVMDNSGVRYALKLVDFNHWNAAERADAYRMFTKELQFLARLGSQSNRIARVFAYEMNDITKTGKILMELGSDDFRSLLPLRDHPIRKIIQEPRRRYFWRQMVEAVHVVHANRIAHSDVKPENFILVNGKLKLIDFGMSFYIPPGLSSLLRPIAGTPDYMPPEVCRSHTTFAVFGYQADVWSLGCILYEMTFGYRPFEHVIGNADKIMTIASMRKALPIPACSSPSIRHLLSRCLHVKPSDRPSTAQILAHPYLTSNAI